MIELTRSGRVGGSCVRRDDDQAATHCVQPFCISITLALPMAPATITPAVPIPQIVRVRDDRQRFWLTPALRLFEDDRRRSDRRGQALGPRAPRMTHRATRQCRRSAWRCLAPGIRRVDQDVCHQPVGRGRRRRGPCAFRAAQTRAPRPPAQPAAREPRHPAAVPRLRDDGAQSRVSSHRTDRRAPPAR